MENKSINDRRIQIAFIENLKSIVFPIVSILISMLVSVFFVMWAKGYSITQYFNALSDLINIIIKGSFGNYRRSLDTVVYITPLIFTGVANAIAFKCGLFNIGVEGQFILGMIAAAVLGNINNLNGIIHVILIIILGGILGGIWGAIPGYLKAKKGINEVINTIMMNYIGMYLANWLILRTKFGVSGKDQTPLIYKTAMLTRFSKLSRANIGIILALLIAIFIFWLLCKTTIGYEIRAVGLNPTGAEYGGINIAKSTIFTMALSGGIAGIGGAVHVSGVLHQIQNFSGFTGFGFDGIAVALLAKSNPIGCIFSSILFGALNSSAKTLQINDIPKEIVYLIQSIVIVFVATDNIVRYISKRRRKKEAVSGGKI